MVTELIFATFAVCFAASALTSYHIRDRQVNPKPRKERL